MRTSASQYEMLLNFIEQHGDLNRLNNSARGKIQTIQNWERITNLLNSVSSGATRNTEKWKKVWSDLKNNTKKKVARIKRAHASGSAIHSHLTDLEQRVLKILLAPAATGLADVREAGFSENQIDSPNETVTLSPIQPDAAGHDDTVVEESPVIHLMDIYSWHEAGPSHTTSPLPSPSPTTNAYQAEIEEKVVFDSPPPADLLRPTQAGQTQQRRRRGIISCRKSSPRRRVIRQPNQMERATEQFLNSDEEWRNFLIKKHKDDCNLEREKLRIRELELETQKKWQEVALLAVDVLNKVIDTRLCKDQ